MLNAAKVSHPFYFIITPITTSLLLLSPHLELHFHHTEVFTDSFRSALSSHTKLHRQHHNNNYYTYIRTLSCTTSTFVHLHRVVHAHYDTCMHLLHLRCIFFLTSTHPLQRLHVFSLSPVTLHTSSLSFVHTLVRTQLKRHLIRSASESHCHSSRGVGLRIVCSQTVWWK